jgi:hypothetical protein
MIINPDIFAQNADSQAAVEPVPQSTDAAAAGPPATGDSAAFAGILALIGRISERLDQQAVPTVVVPAVPVTVTSVAAQEVGKAVALLSQHMLDATSGKYCLDLVG